MSRPRIKSLLLALLSAGLVAAVSGCDLNEDADLANGRELFTTECGVCHALAEAGTTSTIGPDLDASFAAARAAGMDQDTIEGIVEAQIANPRETEEDDPTYMPADIVVGEDATDVAAYVASVAGVPNIKAPVAPGGPGGQVFASAGCAACHVFGAAESGGAVGPNLDESLEGQSEEMIEESIVDPSAVIVEGFDDIMPAGYGESIEPADLETLVNFLATCQGQPAPEPGDPEPEYNEDGSCGAGSAGGGSSGQSSGGSGPNAE